MDAKSSATAALLTEKEAAGLLGWSPRTLQQRRVAGKPPAFIKLADSSSVRYRLEDIESFIAASARHSTTETGK